ncbi:MAG: leucine-rich repeat protein [Clostridia bacterium]|nr:leucine-rich repeat protein [Clostridia bacterium]
MVRRYVDKTGAALNEAVIVRIALVILAVLVSFSSAYGLFRSTAVADSSDIMTIELDGEFIIDSTRQMLNNINDLRANDAWYWNSSDTEKVYPANLVPLEYDYGLERVAMQRAAELAVYYDHTRPNGESCFTAFPNEVMGVGENIAAGYNTPDSVFVAWAEADEPYNGQGHRRNMLDEGFTTVGIGCFEYNGYRYWAQEFGSNHTTAATNPLIPPVSIDVSKDMITDITIGDQITLFKGHAVNIPDVSVSFVGKYIPGSIIRFPVSEENCRIADASVADIADGRIVGLAVGETVLTVTFRDMTLSAVISVVEDQAIPLQLDTTRNVSIPAGETVYFSFTPNETGVYVFYSSGDKDTCGILYNSDKTVLLDDDDGGENYNFSISSELTANTLYYYGVRLYSPDITASVSVTLKKDDTMVSSGFAYKLLDDGTASITGCSLSGDIVIPSALDGYTVTNLASRLFYGKSDISSVTLPASVTYFGTNQNDNDWDYVFSYCFDLKNIFVDNGNPVFKSVDGVLYSKDGSKLINYPCNHDSEIYHVDASTLCCTSFASCRNLRCLFLDNSDTIWYTYTFYNTDNVTVFYKEGGRTAQKVSGDTASSCTFASVRNIAELPSHLERIETQAFQNTDLRYIRIPGSCERIETGAFTGSNLVYVSVDDSTVIEDGAFDTAVVVERR